MFAAYNGGPGWLSRWLATQPADLDPLLLLETLPRAESRDYAERALSHMALCRKAMGQPRIELDRLAAGAPALYPPLDAPGPERWARLSGANLIFASHVVVLMILTFGKVRGATRIPLPLEGGGAGVGVRRKSEVGS